MAWLRWIGLPGVALGGAVLGLLVRVPADGRRVEQDRRALQRRQPRALRVPLVPADQGADAGRPRSSKAWKPRSPGREVVLLVERADRRGCASCGTGPAARPCSSRRPRCCGRGPAPAARRSGTTTATWPRCGQPPTWPRCWARAPARPGRTAPRPRAGRSRASGRARAGRPPGRRLGAGLLDLGRRPARGSRPDRRSCAIWTRPTGSCGGVRTCGHDDLTLVCRRPVRALRLQFGRDR